MMRRLPTGQYGNPRVRRERDVAALWRQGILLMCGLLMAGGFVFAAGQRFAAVRYGYQSEQLREEQARLVAEHERLLLELNAATSPGALEQAARGIGMQPARASQIGNARRSDDLRRSDDTTQAAMRSASSVIAARANVGSHVGAVPKR